MFILNVKYVPSCLWVGFVKNIFFAKFFQFNWNFFRRINRNIVIYKPLDFSYINLCIFFKTKIFLFKKDVNQLVQVGFDFF